MSVIDDIEALQARIDELLDEVPLRQDQAEQAAIDAVLRLLDDRDLASISPARLDEATREALRPATQLLTTDAQSAVQDRLQSLISETQSFYQDRGITVPDRLSEAVRKRQDAQRVTQSLRSGMEIASNTLKRETLEAVEEELASPGSPSRDAIRDRLQDSVDQAGNVVETQARTSMNAYNQEYQNKLASEADLQHFLYAGNLQSNSRRFCIAHVDGVYTSKQISQMQNGQIEPVRTFCGGYNCRHNWTPVDPNWGDELQERRVSDSTDAVSYGQGDRTATIIPTDPIS